MVARSKLRTIGPVGSIAAFSEVYQTGKVVWSRYHALQPREEAQCLLFVHGASHNGLCWGLGQDNWVNFFTERGHEVIIPSLPGHQPSEGSVSWQSLTGYLDALDAVLDAARLRDRQIVVIGHSMGGILAQCLFSRHREMAGAVIVDVPSPARTLAPYLNFFKTYGRRHPLVIVCACLNPGALFASSQRIRELLLGEDAPEELVAALQDTLGGETMRAMLELQRIAKAPLTLPGARVLFLAAEQSAFRWLEEIKASAADVHATCRTVPGGHNVMNTVTGSLPGAREIEAFLASLPTPAEGVA